MRVENGSEVELPDGWEFLAVASTDSFNTWILLREVKSSPCVGQGLCPCKA